MILRSNHRLIRRFFTNIPLLAMPTLICLAANADPHGLRSLKTDEPWLPPIVGSVVEQPFGGISCHGNKSHRGVDIVTRKETGVVAPAAGFVTVAADSDRFFPGLTNLIVIDHGDDTVTVFANLGDRLVKTGELVRRGQRIAMTQVPNRQTRQPHTHVELLLQGKAIDPFERLPYVFFDLQLPPPQHGYKNAPE